MAGVEKALKRVKKTTQVEFYEEHLIVANKTNFAKSLTGIEKEFRLKRSSQTNYYVKYLVVVDSTIVEMFSSIHGKLGEENINDYIKIQLNFVVIQVKLV